MKMTFKEFLTEAGTRRSVMAKLRKKFHLGAENTYSEKQKGSRMVKVYNIEMGKEKDFDLDDMVKNINDYIKAENIEGVKARKMETGVVDGDATGPMKGAGYRRGTKSIAFQFDNEVYGK